MYLYQYIRSDGGAVIFLLNNKICGSEKINSCSYQTVHHLASKCRIMYEGQKSYQKMVLLNTESLTDY